MPVSPHCTIKGIIPQDKPRAEAAQSGKQAVVSGISPMLLTLILLNSSDHITRFMWSDTFIRNIMGGIRIFFPQTT
jgi:hypothetical protein